MTPEQELTFLMGDIESRIDLLASLEEKSRIDELIEQYRLHKNTAYRRRLFYKLIQNPHLQPNWYPSEISSMLRNNENLVVAIKDYLKTGHNLSPVALTLVFNSILAKLLPSTLPKLIKDESVSPRKISGMFMYQTKLNPDYTKYLPCLIKIIQQPNFPLQNLKPVETQLMNKENHILKIALPYVVKVSSNAEFIDFCIEQVIKLPKTGLGFTAHHLVLNPNLSVKQILKIEENIKLKPKQKQTLANHPNRQS